MKKVLLFSLIILLLFFVANFQKSNLCEFGFSKEYTYVLYTPEKVLPNGSYEVTQNGNGFIIKTAQKNAATLLKNARHVSGEALEFITTEGEVLAKEIVKKFNLITVSYEQVEDTVIINGYSKLLQHFILINHEKVNLQIAYHKNAVIVGYPLILHSF